jgi:ABC-type dipeptide/oligopeptide/nickel transport system permease component
MLKFVIRRILWTIPVILVVVGLHVLRNSLIPAVTHGFLDPRTRDIRV